MKPTHDPLGWHITLRLLDGRNLTPGVRERRLIARAILEAGRERGLFLFAVPDTHAHMATAGGREDAGKLAHAVECSLRYRLALTAPFEPARIRPIQDQAHLGNVVPYILGNGRRHKNSDDPGCEGTNLPDLLGLRVTGLYTASTLRRLLPRLVRSDLISHLPVEELRPGTDPRYLADAAAASLALPTITGLDQQQRWAQVAAVHVATQLELGTTQTARLLGLSVSTVARMRKVAPDAAVLHAIRLQMGLMESLSRTETLFLA